MNYTYMRITTIIALSKRNNQTQGEYMNILKIGSKVECTGVKFSGRSNKHFSQSFKVLNVNAIRGWRTNVYCTNMFAIASHKLGVFW